MEGFMKKEEAEIQKNTGKDNIDRMNKMLKEYQEQRNLGKK